MNKSIIFAVLGVALVAIIGAYIYKNQAPSGPGMQTEDGWHTTISGVMADKRSGPRVIVITRAGWSNYERNTYDRPELAKVLEGVVKARLEFSNDSQLAKWEVEGAPALVLLTPEGDLITKIIGPRDVTTLKQAVERSIEFPLTAEQLLARGDTPSHLRWIEVVLEQGEHDTAIAASARYIGGDTSADFAHGHYLHAYALAEKGEFDSGRMLTEKYLSLYPNEKDRAAAHWVLIVLDMQTEKFSAILPRIDQMIAEDSTMPHVRQAIWAYSMEYLARGRQQVKEAEQLLTKYMEKGTPWTNDLRMARASLRVTMPQSMGDAIEDYKVLAAVGGPIGTEAKDRLVMIATAPGGELIMPAIILYFQELAGKANDDGYTRFLLARLYVMSDNLARAREEAKTLASTGGDWADEAALLLGVIELEVEKNPETAFPHFDEIVSKYPDRATVWPARYARGRSLFFSGRLAEAKKAHEEVIAYMENRFYLPEGFLLVLGQPVPPQAISEQLKDYNTKIDELMKEESGEKIFKELLRGVLASSKGDTVVAETAFNSVIAQYPASTLADDALFELAKVHVRNKEIEKARIALDKIITSYKGSDQYEPAEQLLGMITQTRR